MGKKREYWCTVPARALHVTRTTTRTTTLMHFFEAHTGPAVWLAGDGWGWLGTAGERMAGDGWGWLGMAGGGR